MSCVAQGALTRWCGTQKSGFCLGDRYRVTTRTLTSAPVDPTYTHKCGLEQPGLVHLREGISVGYGDDYAAYLEYQDLPLDGLPGGRYVLVHRVNSDRRIQEVSYATTLPQCCSTFAGRSGKPVDLPESYAVMSRPTRCDRRVEGSGLWPPGSTPRGTSPSCRTAGTGHRASGRVRLLKSDGHLRQAPVARITVSEEGEGGLLGLVLDPEFAANRSSISTSRAPAACGSSAGGGAAQGSCARPPSWMGSRQELSMTRVESRSGRTDRLYVATGDAGHPELAQDQGSLNGKLLALTPHEYRGSGAARPAVVASGLRNSQGFDWQPGTGALIANDHGPSGFDGPEGYDEVDRIVQARNYGWPEVMGGGTGKRKFIAPLRVYLKPIAPSGALSSNQRGPAWTGNYVIAALRSEELRRLVVATGGSWRRVAPQGRSDGSVPCGKAPMAVSTS